MNKILLCGLFLICVFFACNEKKKEEKKIYDPIIEAEARRITDSIINDVKQSVVRKQQTVSEQTSPVRVTTARLSTDEYGSTDIVVTVKNVSERTVDGIKVRWLLQNNFGESVSETYDGGISQRTLRVGKSDTYRWNIYSTSATKVSAFIYEVHFKDGETWSAK